jgi:hypothetical protein
MTVLDEGVGPSVQQLDPSTLKVRVTMKSNPSTVNSQPPPTEQISYGFKLTLQQNGTTSSAQKESTARNSLWKMPDGFARYGIGSVGGNDWCSHGAYLWLQANAQLVTRIGDISGEHARYIGHQTHQYGTDIDIFHFYRFPNYFRLQADTILAFQTNSSDPTVAANALAAQQRVTNWVTASRTGLDKLAASQVVANLLYVRGFAANGLQVGWARDLLQTGQTTLMGQTLNLGIGAWSNSKVIYRLDHYSHIHITLDRSQLGD